MIKKRASSWNKGITGYSCHHKIIDTVDWTKVKQEILLGNSINDIAKTQLVSSPTIYKYSKLKFPELIERIKFNGLQKKKNINYKTGHCAKYIQLRKLIRQGAIKCSKCRTDKNVQIHHKEKLKYNQSYEMWKASNFKNNIEDVDFLCNSCHQKLHYRKLGKVSKVKHCKETGRFIKND